MAEKVDYIAQKMQSLVNGHAYDFSSIRIMFNSIYVSTAQSISYEYSRDIGILRGTTAFKHGRTRGQFDCSGSLTMYQEEWLLLQASLTSAVNLFPKGTTSGYMEKSFQIIVAYADFGLVPSADVLEDCTITGVRRNHSQGAEALMVELDLDIMRITENGQSPMGKPL